MNAERIKDILRPAKRGLSSVIEKLDLKILPVFALNGFLASVYFTFINRSFYREHLSVLRGRLNYSTSLAEIGSSSALLRRNTHRLEKGLIMQPRRKVFAKAYIGETVDCYARCLSSGTVDSEEMRWAHDVISEYFSVVADDEPVIERYKKKYQDLNCCENNPASDGSQEAKPYAHRDLPRLAVDYPSLHSLFQRRRSVRWYQNKRVSKELVEQAVNAASLAPSACNRQPYRFVFFEQPQEAADVAALAMGTAGFGKQIPSLFVAIGDLSCYPKGRDRHVIYIDASLAAMQLMLALETLGLSSCPINWPDIEGRERKMAKRLGLGSHERVVILIACGYAENEGGVPFSQKKDATSLLQAC